MKHRIELRNEAAELDRAMREVSELMADDVRLSAVAAKVQIALDEMVGNMLRYGEFQPPIDPFPISVEIGVDETTLTIVLVDSASGFNPLQAAKPDIGLSIEERPVGGLGIHLVTQVFDSVEYQRKDNKNRLTLKLLLPGID